MQLGRKFQRQAALKAQFHLDLNEGNLSPLWTALTLGSVPTYNEPNWSGEIRKTREKIEFA